MKGCDRVKVCGRFLGLAGQRIWQGRGSGKSKVLQVIGSGRSDGWTVKGSRLSKGLAGHKAGRPSNKNSGVQGAPGHVDFY